jgi:hypothetical protein
MNREKPRRLVPEVIGSEAIGATRECLSTLPHPQISITSRKELTSAQVNLAANVQQRQAFQSEVLKFWYLRSPQYC